MICTYCEGKRVVSMEIAKGDYAYVACPRCNGTGVESERPYYVIWFNRELRCIELHKPFCEHDLAKNDKFYSIGGDNVDPKEMVKTLPDNYRTVAMSIEECLR